MRAARVSAAAAGLALAALAAGCTAEGGNEALRDEADRGYVAGDSSLRTLGPAERESVAVVAGETAEGEQVDLAGLGGDVVVLNVWGSWCPPCHTEAPDLVEAYAELPDDGVSFVGINVNDTEVGARRFEDEYGITWPSVFDPDGRQLLGLRGQIPPQAFPSTLVVDPAGRIAAVVVGPVERSVLVTLVEDVLAEEAGT